MKISKVGKKAGIFLVGKKIEIQKNSIEEGFFCSSQSITPHRLALVCGFVPINDPFESLVFRWVTRSSKRPGFDHVPL